MPITREVAPITNPRIANGPRGLPMFGSVLDLRRKGVLDFWIDVWHKYGDVARADMGPLTIYQFVRPEHVQHILVRNGENYVKGFSHDKLRVPLGMGILTNEGSSWRRQRRLMAPIYTPLAVTRFSDIMSKAITTMLSRWQAQPQGTHLSVDVEMMRLTMSVISQSMFTFDIGEAFAKAGEALAVILDFANKRTISLIDPPLYLPTPMNRRYRWAVATLDRFLYDTIAERRMRPPGSDLLSTLLQARDEETGQQMTDRQLRDEVLIIFFAGHETTAQLLTWAWILLAQHPEAEARFHSELEQVLAGRSPVPDDLPNLVYTRMVIDEVLRLYSPVAMMARDAVADDDIDGFAVPAGSMVTITPYITHRHPEFWARPEAFHPEHFSPEHGAERPRYAYYPFGAGPRVCLGKHFALLEAALVMAEIGQRYRLRLVPGIEIGVRWSGTLRPSSSVQMVLEARPGS